MMMMMMMMMMIMIFMGKVEGNSNFEANGGDDVYKFHFEMFQLLQCSLLCAELTGKRPYYDLRTNCQSN